MATLLESANECDGAGRTKLELFFAAELSLYPRRLLQISRRLRYVFQKGEVTLFPR